MATGAYGENDTIVETTGAYSPNDTPVGEEQKPSGALRRAIGDKALGFASGAVGATKAIADVAGAGNVVSTTLDAANKGINEYLSPEAKADQREQSRIMEDAKGKGLWEGVKAGARAFAEAPVQTAIQGLGSVVPIIAGTAVTGGAAPAAAVGAGIGAAMGAGTAKGAIYDEIKKRGGTEEEAIKAQEYGGPNTDQIALGGALGTADALTGVSKMAGNMVRGALRKPVTRSLTQATERGVLGRAGMGMLSEMPLEAAQGGQEQVAANLAAQRAGYQAGTWDNVASNATLEALASAGPGAAFGAAHRANAATPPNDGTTPPNIPGTPPAVPPEQPPVAAPGPFDGAPPAPYINTRVLDANGLTPKPPAPVLDTQRLDDMLGTPSQQIGLDPAAGPMSAAAAIAVDTGAHDIESQSAIHPIMDERVKEASKDMPADVANAWAAYRAESESLQQDELDVSQGAAPATPDWASQAVDEERQFGPLQSQPQGMNTEQRRANIAKRREIASRNRPNGETNGIQPVPTERGGEAGDQSPAGVGFGDVDGVGRGADTAGYSPDNVVQPSEPAAKPAKGTLRPTFNQHPTTLGTQITAKAGPGFDANSISNLQDAIARIRQAKKSKPTESTNVPQATQAQQESASNQEAGTQAPVGSATVNTDTDQTGNSGVQTAGVVPLKRATPEQRRANLAALKAKMLAGRKPIIQAGKQEQPSSSLPEKLSNSEQKDNESNGYALPDKVSDDWGGTAENASAERTPRQKALMDVVARVLDEGKFYNREIEARAAELLNVPRNVLAQNNSNVEGGDFGYDVYHARKAVEAQRSNKKSQDIANAMGLKVGDVIGTLVTNDGKRSTGMTVTAISESGLSFTLNGKRGIAEVSGTMGADAIQNGINRAKEKGARKDGYNEFVASRKQPAQPAANAGEGAGASQPTQEAANVSSIPLSPKAGEDTQPTQEAKATANQPALDRIAKGDAWFGNELKARNWVQKNGLADTHHVKMAKPGRFEVVAKAAVNESLAPEAPNSPNAIRAARIKGALATGGRVVDGELRTNNGLVLMKLTPEELQTIPADRKTTSQDVKAKRDAVYGERPEPQSEFSDTEKALQAKTRDNESDGDVGVVVGGGLVKFASLADAVDAVKAAIASGTKPVPFQIHNATGIRLGDVDRVLKAIEPVQEKNPSSPLVKAMNDLMEVRQRIADQGRVVDDRLVERERQLAKIVKELEAESKPTTVNVPATVSDALDAQMQKQKGRITRLKNEAEKAGSLEDKRAAQLKVTAAETTLRQMRLKRFDAEDAAVKAVESGDAKQFAEFADLFPGAAEEIAKLTGQNDELDAEMRSYEVKKTPTYSGEENKPQAPENTAPAATKNVAKKQQKAPSAAELKARADLMAGLADLADIMGANFKSNMMPEQRHKLMPVLTRILDASFRLGYIKFKDAAKFALEQIRTHLGAEAASSLTLDDFQGAYISMAAGKEGVDTKRAVIDVESMADIDGHKAQTTAELENNAEQADTSPKEAQNEPTDTGIKDSEALGDMASNEDRGTEGKRGVGRGRSGGRTSSAPDDSGITEPRVSGTRSGGSGSTSIRAPKAGGTGRGRRTGAGTEGNGSQLPAERGPVPVDDLFSDKPAAEPVSANNIQASNFRITPDLRIGQGGEAEKFRDNLAAIRTLKAIEAENRRATSEEQRIMARYVGWGGLANAFPNPDTKEWKDDWKTRGAELKELLTAKEYDLARRSTLDSHYTSQTVVNAMWEAASRLGFKGGMAAETSMGIGNFLGLMPEGLAGNTKFIGVEYDSLTARMAGLLYPQATVLHSGLQKVPLPESAFDLNIGNPPFGDQSLRFQFKPEFNRVSIHNQFFLAGIDSLKPGGLQLNVVSRYLLDAMDKTTRTMLAKKAKLVAAIRLPDTAFKENARTSVVTDIVMLQRLTPAEEAHMNAVFAAAAQKPEKERAKEDERRALAAQVPDWVEVTKVRDPLGGDPMTVNNYFASNPGMILGTLERSGKMQFKNDITVRPSDRDLGEMLKEAIAKLPQDIANTTHDAIAASLERHATLSDALRISLSGQEAGSIAINKDGQLEQVYERETPEGDYELAKRVLTETSPWSESLYQDSKGNWFTIEAKLDAEGNKVKVVKDGKATKNNVYERKLFASESDIPEGLRLGPAKFKRLQKLVKLRDLMVNQINLETEDAPPIRMEGNRHKLAEAYKAFVDEEGFISRPANSALVANMPDGALVQALELGYRKEITKDQAKKRGEEPRPEQADPAPILRERVIPKYEPPTKAATAADALSIAMSESGRVDIERMASLLGKTEEEVTAEMFDKAEKPLIFKDPETQQWVTRNDYLTGQVKKKLHAAQAAGLEKHVRELEAVQPEPWGAENVTVLLGSTFVPPQVYADFIQHVTGKPARVSFSQATNTYAVQANGATAEKHDEWGARGITIAGMVSNMLNGTPIRVTTKDSDGNTVLDRESTDLALLKARQIASEFTDWAFANGDRRKLLVDLFNEKYNTRVSRQHDGSHLSLPGKVPDQIISMRRHQKNAIWRGISERFMLIDHAVGAGKTFTAIARAMERRRMGLSRKPAIVVPNHMVEQFTSDVYRLYPGAKVLAAGSKDFDRKKRRKLFAKIASGDWDIVIIPHSSFGFIGIAPETEERYLEQELAIAEQAIKEAWEESEQAEGGRFKPFTVKQAERLRDKITASIEKVRGDRNKDRLLTFEQMGIDDLTVDEAHEFKNLFYSSRLKDVKGMGNPTGSQKAFDLYNKVRVLRESPTGTVTFMTGTPISNSAVEMFTMMRYLAADELRELGMEHFDAWRSQFVSADPGWEPTETGRLKEVTRLGRSWSNMRSLMDLYYSFTDSVSNGDIKKAYAEDNNGKKFPIPAVKGDDRKSVVIQPTKDQIALLEDTMAAFDSLPEIEDPYDRNKERLRLMDRARKISLDVRAAVPGHQGKEAGGKLEKIATEVKRIYDKWEADKGTQLIFLDRSVPKSKGDDKRIKEFDDLIARRNKALLEDDEAELRRVSESLESFDSNEIDELRAAQAGGWNAYQQIKDNLIARGIPAKEIRFIQEATNDAQKQALFDAVKAGEVRVLIGSTPRMGAGTNVQDRLVGLHHADVTWKPSDIEQREGRIIRQGNKLIDKYGIDNFEVEILAYATERTIDSKMWSLNSAKLKTINAIREYDGSFSMDFDDNDSVSMAEMAALASGNPLLLERVKLDSDINNLELLRKQHQRKTWGYKSRLEDAENDIKNAKPRKERAEKLAVQAKAGAEELAADLKTRTVTVEGKEYSNHSDAVKAADESRKAQQNGDEEAKFSVKIGESRVTTMNGAFDKVYDALGDDSPFLANVKGVSYRSRTALAREVAKLATEAAGDIVDGESKTLTTGKMLGFTVEAVLSKGAYRGYELEFVLVDADGRTVSSTVSRSQQDSKFVTSMFTKPLADLDRGINPDYFESEARLSVQRAEKAQKELPELKTKANTPFAKEQELSDKRVLLAKVIAALAAGQSSIDGGSGASTNIKQTGAPEANETDVVFSRVKFSRAAQGQANDTVEKTVADIVKGWATRPKIVVAFDMNDERIPERVRMEDQKQRSGGAEGAPEGFYYKGVIYLMSSKLATPEDVARVLFHETLGHHGLRSVFGKSLKSILNRIATFRKAEVDAKMKQYGLKGISKVDRMTAAEEVLAEMAQDRPNIGFVREAIAAIRTWLRNNVPGFKNLALTDDEIIRSYILPARNFVERGGQASFGMFAPSMARDASERESDVSPLGFYSALARGIEQSGANAAPAFGWKATIKGLVNKGMAKADEVEWSGLNDWLDMQTGKVSKEAVMEYLRNNGVQIEEVTLSGDKHYRDARGNRVFDDETGDYVAARNPAKYGNYTLPGGENYREVLLTLPSTVSAGVLLAIDERIQDIEDERDGASYSERQDIERRLDAALAERRTLTGSNYRSPHWSQPNVLAHIRLNDRTDADGARVLFVEEIQSDWGQAGKKQGFDNAYVKQVKPGEFNAFVDELRSKAAAKMESVGVAKETAEFTAKGLGNDMLANMVGMRAQYDDLMRRATEDRNAEFHKRDKAVPAAPFVTKTDAWVNLALKRIAAMAVAEGYDKVAFVNGDQSAERYDLSKQVDSIEWMKNDRGYAIAADQNGRTAIEKSGLSDTDLADTIGKELAQKIIDSGKNSGKLSNIDLKVGGEGMKAFYNQIIPGAVKKLVTKLGGEVGEVDILRQLKIPSHISIDELHAFQIDDGVWSTNFDDKNFGSKQEAESYLRRGEVLSQPGFTITDSMREKVAGGVPLFSRTETLRKVGAQLNDMLDAPGKLNWWHKSIGTMYNLAERSAPFKRVFQSAQKFIDDVSFYANDAAELAPNLLPKLEEWKDVLKSPISAQDSKAVAKPVFEGTLMWTRDEKGNPVLVEDRIAQAADMTTDEKAHAMLKAGKINPNVLRMWQGMKLDDYEAAIASRYESQMLRPGIVWTDAELTKRFGLNDAQRGFYKEFRAAVNKSLEHAALADMVRLSGKDGRPVADAVMESATFKEGVETLREYIKSLAEQEPSRADNLNKIINGIDQRELRIGQLKDEGYAPLSRFGKYTVHVTDDAGESRYFGMFETPAEANRMAAMMRQEHGKDAVKQGTQGEMLHKLFSGVTPETLELFGDMLGLDAQGDNASDKAYQSFLRLTKSNRSALRRLIHRKGTAGYSEDVGRVLAAFVTSNARHTAANLNMGELSESVADIPKGQGELQDAAIRLSEYVRNPQEEASQIRGLLFAQYLGGSIASAFVNMTQPAAVTFPWLSRFGGVKQAAAEIGRAAKQMSTGHKFEPDLAKALKHAEEDGTVSPQEVHQLMAQASGTGALRVGDGTKLGDAKAIAQNNMARLALAWGKVFGMAEQTNRRLTFIAAYRVAKAQGMDNPAEFAKRAVTETQFTYNKANKMRWGRGAVGGTLMTFKTYSIAYLELMNRMWTQGGPEGKKAVLLAMAVLLLMGGAGGLPFADDADDLIDALAQLTGHNFSSKKAKQELFENLFGKAGAGFVMHGITGLPGSPVDVSGRLGMGNLIPGTGILLDKQDHTRDVMELLGPVGDFASRIGSGARKVLGGDLAGGVMETMPTAVRNLAKGIDMGTSGIYKDAKGYKVIDTTAGEAVAKAIGFQPQSVAKVQEANAITQREKNFYSLNAERIRMAWAKGVFERDPEQIQEARDMLKAWNEKNPDQRITISIPAVMKKAREMAKDRSQRIADTAPKPMREQLRREIAERALQ